MIEGKVETKGESCDEVEGESGGHQGKYNGSKGKKTLWMWIEERMNEKTKKK